MGERSVECSHCKKPVKVIYHEVIGKTMTRTEMCADCPILQQKLHGQMLPSQPSEKTDLCCGNCGTPYEFVKTGNPLGCRVCYNVFADLLVTQLIESNSIPAKLKKSTTMKRMQLLHVGKSPEKAFTPEVGSRLLALNEQLNEALQRENYEQAAWIRDQIKALKEKDEGKKG